jgi:hypothetical protein
MDEARKVELQPVLPVFTLDVPEREFRRAHGPQHVLLEYPGKAGGLVGCVLQGVFALGAQLQGYAHPLR